MKSNNLSKILVMSILLVYTLSFVSSVNIGISPASVKFEDVVRNGYAERYIVVSADSESPVEVELTPRGEIKDWISYPEETFKVSRDKPYYVKVSITPPVDTPNGNYSGFIKFLTTSQAQNIEDHAVGKILSSLDLALSVGVTDIEVKDCSAKNIKITSVEQGDDVVLSMDVLNKGNVKLNMRALFDVWDQDQISVVKSEEFFGQSILPTVEEPVEFRFTSSDMDLGQYWGELSLVECLQESLLTFDVLEEGALKSKGILLNILSKREAKTKETVAFAANFKNTGEKEVTAEFKGKATLNGVIVQTFESEKLKVAQDMIDEFSFFFTPQKAGKYVVSGRVYYDGKKTYEVSTTLDVLSSGFSVMPVVYGILIFVIIFFVVKIRHDKKVYREKLRRLK